MMPGETPYCSPIDPFDESKGYECGAASLLADNARLQARVKDSIAVIDVAAAGAVRLKRERDRLQADVELALGMPLNERIDALVVSRDRYKALAERRGEALEWDRWLIAMLVATEYTQHAEGCPREWDKECECWVAQVFTAAEARAAIDAEEAKEARP